MARRVSFTIDSLRKWLIVAKRILKKVQKRQRPKKQNNPNFQYSTIGRRILATDNTPYIINIHNIKKISLEEIQNKKQKEIKKFFAPNYTNKITNKKDYKSNEESNIIVTTASTTRYISKSHCNKPVGPKNTKENNKDKKKTSTDIVLYNSNSNTINNSKIKESEILQPPVQNFNLDNSKSTVAKKTKIITPGGCSKNSTIKKKKQAQ